MRVLLTLEEVRDALAGLEFIPVGGVDCVDGEQLLAVISELVPIRASSRHPAAAPRSDVFFSEPLRAVPEPPADPAPPAPSVPSGASMTVMLAPTIEVAQAILDSFPRGDCVGCHHLDHFDGRCPECDCVEYVDSVVRDPTEYARDLMTQGADAPPWWPAAGGIQSMISVAENEGFTAGRLMHHGGGPAPVVGENINPNPPAFQLPPVE